MVRITLFYFILFFSTIICANEIKDNEKMLFNFIDLNNDKNLSFGEITTSLKLIFQLIDENRDGKISEKEIIELKNIIESLS